MRNNVLESINCDIIEDLGFDDRNSAIVVDFCAKKNPVTGLTSCVKQFHVQHGRILLDGDFSNRKVYNLALRLARALDNNSPNDIKFLKMQYGATQEFLLAKDFLDRKCKQIWDVFDKDFNPDKVPYEAMKMLGISNKQPIGFYLENFLTYFEKDGGTTTVDIINSLIQNTHSGYTFDDIYDYFKATRRKYKFNQITIAFLASKLDYNQKELLKVGVEKSDLRVFYKNLPILRKIQILIKNLLKKM